MTAPALLRLLGLGHRARHLVVGVQAVRARLQDGSCHVVVLAEDASDRTLEKVARLATAKAVPTITGPSAAAIGAQLGMPPVMAVGVRDRALADGIRAVGAGTPIAEA